MICSKCGNVIEDNSSFCNFCGAPTGPSQGFAPPENGAYNPYGNMYGASPVPYPVVPPKKKNVLMLIGSIVALVGSAGFALIALVGLTVYGHIYLYDGYAYTRVLCTICIVLQCVGISLIVLGLILKRFMRNGVGMLVLSIISMALAATCAIILIINAALYASNPPKRFGRYSLLNKRTQPAVLVVDDNGTKEDLYGLQR